MATHSSTLACQLHRVGTWPVLLSQYPVPGNGEIDEFSPLLAIHSPPDCSPSRNSLEATPHTMSLPSGDPQSPGLTLPEEPSLLQGERCPGQLDETHPR